MVFAANRDSGYDRCASSAQNVLAEADRPMSAVRIVGVLAVELLKTRAFSVFVQKMFL
jgi:hypothetical protein